MKHILTILFFTAFFAANAQTGQRVTLTISAGGTDTTSISNRIDAKLNISDTAAMLLAYLRKADTSGMLLPYLRKADTLQYASALAALLRKADTAAMLAPYLRKADTLQYASVLALKLDIADTSDMLSGYQRKGLTLPGLTDIDTAGIRDGDFLRYDSSISKWVVTAFPSIIDISSAPQGLRYTPNSLFNPTDSSLVTRKWVQDRGYLTGNQTITLSGDVTGSGATAITTTLANSGVSAGTYTSATITVDAKGRVTAASSNTAGTDPTIQQYVPLGLTMRGYTVGRDPLDVTSVSNMVDNRIDFTALYIPAGATITGVGYYVGTAGNYTGDQTNSIALYSYSGGTLTKVAETSNSEAHFEGTSNTWRQVAFASPYVAAAGTYFIGFLANWSAVTTTPQIGGFNLSNAAASGSGGTLFTNSAKTSSGATGQNSQPATIAASAAGGINTVRACYVY